MTTAPFTQGSLKEITKNALVKPSAFNFALFIISPKSL